MTGPHIGELLERYLNMRGMAMPDVRSGEWVVEEAQELAQALEHGELANIRHEIADVVLAAAVVAHAAGVTVEDCIREKTDSDAGRGPSHRSSARWARGT